MHNRILRVEERNPRPRVFQPIQNESTKAAADIGKCPGGVLACLLFPGRSDG